MDTSTNSHSDNDTGSEKLSVSSLLLRLMRITILIGAVVFIVLAVILGRIENDWIAFLIASLYFGFVIGVKFNEEKLTRFKFLNRAVASVFLVLLSIAALIVALYGAAALTLIDDIDSSSVSRLFGFWLSVALLAPVSLIVFIQAFMKDKAPDPASQ